ncbi:MAG: NAD(P)/FAD-dependent oxidoreductase [Candidatus Neomarinimicrobiota bacterium]
MERFDVVIIGAGAAGLTCAMAAGQRGRRVLLIDHAREAGRKILISGGGRCNFTNRLVTAANYISANPHFCKSALSRFSPEDFIALIEKHGIAWEEREHGQLFCRDRAQGIVDLLLAECRAAGVELRTGCTVTDVRREGDFHLSTSSGEIAAATLVVACGGLSLPKIGASSFGFDLARRFGLNVLPPVPGLVPLTFSDQMVAICQTLSGISLPVKVSGGGRSFREALLFTHRGLSGPAILQISNYWRPGSDLTINLLPDTDLTATILIWQREQPKVAFRTLIGHLVTRRLAQQFLPGVEYDRPVNRFTTAEIQSVARLFQEWTVRPAGTAGFDKAEVTNGGVDTAELSSKTFETKKVPGLYFIGEVVDVTGWLGGYNLQWAWSSGYCAGQYV